MGKQKYLVSMENESWTKFYDKAEKEIVPKRMDFGTSVSEIWWFENANLVDPNIQ